MATLYKKNGYYYINYSIHGKRVRKSVGPDKREAGIYLKELKYRLFKGDLKPARPRMPVNYVINRYLKNCQSRLVPSVAFQLKVDSDDLQLRRGFVD